MAQSKWTRSEFKESWSGPHLKRLKMCKAFWASATFIMHSLKTFPILLVHWTISLAKMNPGIGPKNAIQPLTALKKCAANTWSYEPPIGLSIFLMDTDASGYALGVVISQEFEDSIHPIAFHSWSLLPAEANYDAHDKELAGVIFGFKCGRPLFQIGRASCRERVLVAV